MNAIPGKWRETISKRRETWLTVQASGIIHFIKTGDTLTMCGRGRPSVVGARARGVELGPEVHPAGFDRCQLCIDFSKAEARKRRATAARFIELLDRLPPAERQQVAAAWPAHAREDHAADWWMTHAPHYINNMKEAIRLGRNK